MRSFLAQELRFGTGQVAQKASKSSFSMGFRSYVRHFFGAFFAPSPWRFTSLKGFISSFFWVSVGFHVGFHVGILSDFLSSLISSVM